MQVEVNFDDEVIDRAIAISLVRLMKDMLEAETNRQIPYFSSNEKKEKRMKKKLLKAARLVHNYCSVPNNHINKDFSNL